MPDLSTATVIASDLNFPEGLRWHDGALWFTDQFAGKLHRVDESRGNEVVARVPSPSGLGWLPDGLLLFLSMLTKQVMSLDADGEMSTYADLSQVMPATANDMLVDSLGRAYVGNYGFDYEHGETKKPTRMVRVDPDRSIHVEEPEMWFPNGTILIEGGARMVVAESYGDRLTSYRVGADGSLDDQKVLAELPVGCGPDGICADADGRIWVACAYDSHVRCVTPDGKLVDELVVPGEGVYCPEIGGPDGTTLFLAIASLDEQEAMHVATGRVVAMSL